MFGHTHCNLVYCCMLSLPLLVPIFAPCNSIRHEMLGDWCNSAFVTEILHHMLRYIPPMQTNQCNHQVQLQKLSQTTCKN